MTTLEVGRKLVELVNQGKTNDCLSTLYSPNIVSIEPQSSPNMPARQEGIAAIRAKTDWWVSNHEIHGGKAEGPWPHGDRFIVHFNFDVTPRVGPGAGKRMKIDETALYTVKNDKIVHEEFFYHMG